MKIDRDQAEFLDNAIKEWQQKQLIDEKTALKIRESYEVKGFDWERLAKYSFWVAMTCVVVAMGSLIFDKQMIKILGRLMDTPDSVIAILSAITAAILFYFANKKQHQKPKNVFSNQAIIFGGVLLASNAFIFFGKLVVGSSINVSWIFLLATITYVFLAIYNYSALILVFAFVTLGVWYGTFTLMLSQNNPYFLGLNFPLRYVIFGGFLIVLTEVVKSIRKPEFAFPITQFMAYLYFFTALWLTSIFGNFINFESWDKINQLSLFLWALLSVMICLGALLYGLKFKKPMIREFGVTFLLINLYSRFFEYFWDSLHKALFFSILALSFWLIGSKAEKIWHLSVKD